MASVLILKLKGIGVTLHMSSKKYITFLVSTGDFENQWKLTMIPSEVLPESRIRSKLNSDRMVYHVPGIPFI